MQPKEFRYTLIVPAVDSYILPNAPSGWSEDSTLEFSRSETYFGAVRSLTIPLKFVLDGAWILRREYYRYGVQAQVYIQIDKQNTSTWDYEIAYYGKLDFSKAKDEEDYFTVNATDADLSVKIKAFENVKYEIPVDVPEAIEIEITPLKLIESADLLFVASLTDQQPGYTGLNIVNNEVKSVNQSVKDVSYRTDTSPNFATDIDWFFNAQTTGDVTFKFDGVKGSTQTFLGSARRFRIQLVKQDGTVLATPLDVTHGLGAPAFDINQTYTISINAGDKVFVYQRIDGDLDSNTGFNYTEGTLSASYETISPATKCKALRPAYVFQQLVKQMNGGFAYPVQSFLLKEWEQLTITCGDAIRQIEGAKVKTTFADFFKSVSGVTCAGHAVENGMATMEYRPSYYRNSQTLSMLDSKDVTIEPALDLMFNSIKAGYETQTYDEVNGKDEINAIQQYVLDVYAPIKELDITSAYRADAYGIEFLRINLDGKSTTDNDADNDVFFIYVNPVAESGGYYRPLTTSSITGVKAGETYYNWYISPHRNLLRWGAYIHSVFYGNEGYQIRFVSGEKNTAVSTTYGGSMITENSNVNIAELAPPYFQSHYASFTTKLPADFWQYVNNGVYGYGLFSYVGVNLKGFFINASIDLAMNSERDFKCLLTVDNNLLELVR